MPCGWLASGISIFEYGMPYRRDLTDAPGNRSLSSEAFDCDASGQGCTRVRSTYLRYEYEFPCIGDFTHRCEESNRRLASRRTVFHDDGDRWKQTTWSDFDGLGHYRTTTENSNYPAATTRSTTVGYNPGFELDVSTSGTITTHVGEWPPADPWILGTYDEASVSEGSQTAVRQACFGVSGELLFERILEGSSPGSHDVVAAHVVDSEGNRVEERYYGGDVQSVPTPAGGLCDFVAGSDEQVQIRYTYSDGGLASSRYWESDTVAASFYTVDRDIDPNTGLVAASRDVAGLQTTYEYDGLGRLRWQKPAAGHDAWTEYQYVAATPSAPAKVKVFHRSNGTTTGFIDRTEIWYDDFGRVWRELEQMPDESSVERWSLRETRYDGMGRQSQVSQPLFVDIANPATPTRWTEYLGYDPFGRPATIRPPDGSAHDVTFAYTGDRVTTRTLKVATGVGSETTATTTERSDAYGRLYQVAEYSHPDGSAVTTTYGYDVGNRLKQVSTAAEGETQLRTFTYDNRGFLLSETHPEKGAAVTYSAYDARGHATRRVDGPSALTYVYDREERLTQVNETASGQRTLKEYTYGTANSGSDRRLGKLWKASRFQYDIDATSMVPPGYIFADGFESGDLSRWGDPGEAPPEDPIPTTAGNLFDAWIREVYTYAERGGRVSDKTLTGRFRNAAVPWTDVAEYVQSWTYDDLGSVKKTIYPECLNVDCTGDVGVDSRTVTNNYKRGLLSEVEGYASSISYHATGLYNRISHTNGVAVTQAADPNGLARPASISATKSGTLWSTGTYAYDGAGNIASIGSSSFTYDALSRVKSSALNLSATAPAAPTDVTQSITYDTFGNIQSIAGTAGRNTPTDRATNRLSSPAATYDAAGNLTSWIGATYEYDTFNQMVRFTSGGQDWVYVYSADDERIWSVQLPTAQANDRLDRWTLRDLSGKVLREYAVDNGADWRVEKDYVYRSGQLLAAETSAGTRLFHLDHLGTPRLVTDSAGNQVAYHVYYPFGEEATDPGQDLEAMKFTGHERDLNDPNGVGDDLDYMHARFCSPLTGRFLSSDTHRGNQKRPQTLNRYSYVSGNPLRKIDPNGLAELEFTIKTFIPAPSVKLFGTSFGGDARGFSFESRGYRTMQVLRIETDPARAANPLRSHLRDVGVTHRLSPDPASAKASVGGLLASGSRDAGGNALVTVRGSADNPLANPSAAIDYSLKISASATGDRVSVGGTQDGFPAMEIYVKNEQGKVVPVYLFDPDSVGNGLGSLFPGIGDQSVSVDCSGLSSNSGSCAPAPK